MRAHSFGGFQSAYFQVACCDVANDFIINKRDPQPLKKKLSDRIHRELNTTNPCGEWMKYSLKPIVSLREM